MIDVETNQSHDASKGDGMLDGYEITKTREQRTAVIHITTPRAEIESVMGPAINETMAAMAAQGIQPAGPLFSYHLQRPTDIFDFEVGFPVNAEISASGRVKASRLPAVTVARCICRGGYEGLAAAWGDFFARIKAEGFRAEGSLWECYTSGPETSSDPTRWATELNLPLKE